MPLEKAAAASRYSLVQAPALPSGQDGSFTSLSGAGGLLAAQWAMIKTVAPVVPGASREGTR